MDIAALQSFASSHNFNLTGPLDSQRVRLLAEHWLPQVRFFYEERYHPISLRETVELVASQFAQLPPASQEAFKVQKFVKQGSTAVRLAFDPPLVTVADGAAQLQGTTQAVATVRVLTESEVALTALGATAVGSDARVTHGASETRSRRFFGGAQTILGGAVPSPQDPLIPRARTDDGTAPQVTISASYKNLLETLEYNLLVQEDDSYPPDVLRTDFDVLNEILRPIGQQVISNDLLRTQLLAMIAAHKAGDPLPALPPGLFLDKRAWDALTRFAFIEYSFHYAYNDFERYQTAIFDNEHEGDDEGCCLVFDRSLINLAVSVGTDEALLLVQPHSIITSVHEEWQGADRIKVFPTPTIPPATPAELREQLNPVVWVAGGSHATYLTPGTHDLVDFGDYLGWVNENAPWLWLDPPLVLTVAIILHIIEHFVDTEDFTSDDGIRTGPGADPALEPLAVAHRLQIIPMSSDDHIYQSQHVELLTLSAFPGYWGGHNGTVDKSPQYIPKTGRYFRKLLGSVG